MKKILAIITLLFLTMILTTNVSATTVHFPSNKVHIPHHTISNKNNNKVQETESDIEKTTTQDKNVEHSYECSTRSKIVLGNIVISFFIILCIGSIVGCLLKCFDEAFQHKSY